jgi:hypothetical protein
MNIDFFSIDNGVFFDLLGKAGLDVAIQAPCESPAKAYNDFIRFSDAQYLCFIHADVTAYGLQEAIERTIKAHPDFGALGAVGSNKGTIWGRRGLIQEVVTVDSCCIVINTEHGLFFDEKTFDSFHLYVENYCMEVRSLGLKNYTLDLNAYEGKEGLVPDAPYFVHWSHTCHELGFAWGEYSKYRKLLGLKWPDVETT